MGEEDGDPVVEWRIGVMTDLEGIRVMIESQKDSVVMTGLTDLELIDFQGTLEMLLETNFEGDLREKMDQGTGSMDLGTIDLDGTQETLQGTNFEEDLPGTMDPGDSVTGDHGTISDDPFQEMMTISDDLLREMTTIFKDHRRDEMMDHQEETITSKEDHPEEMTIFSEGLREDHQEEMTIFSEDRREDHQEEMTGLSEDHRGVTDLTTGLEGEVMTISDGRLLGMMDLEETDPQDDLLIKNRRLMETMEAGETITPGLRRDLNLKKNLEKRPHLPKTTTTKWTMAGPKFKCVIFKF